MKVPKYIETALKRRVKGACMVMDADLTISGFIEKYGIEVESEDYGAGVEIYSAPYDSAERILKAIKEKQV